MAKDQVHGQIGKALEKAQQMVDQVKPESNSAANDLPKWVCRVEGTPQEAQWTVGEVFHLECEGASVEFNSTDIHFQHAKEQLYALKVLEVDQQSSNSLSLKATSYQPGTHNFKALVIAEKGDPKVVMEPLQLNVKSVITDPQQKPFGPISAMKLSYPMWLWVSLGVIVLGAAFWGLFRLRRSAQMKKVIEELKQHNTALGPFNQFHKDLRTLRRKNIFTDKWSDAKKERYVESLDEIFRMYLLREFFIPALDWSSKLIVKEISKSDKKRFSKYGDDLQGLLKELDRAKADIDNVKVHGCQQLTGMAVKVSQNMWQTRKAQ
ncbi:MAG: hypothetical protein HRT44_09150 [Bdellovibrionales bacterium]|nr:hypothetical protein [Bdellovibrionales bacterium]NQZ19407.1 hypothetical protein [Bdellovibrionales bacterium]